MAKSRATAAARGPGADWAVALDRFCAGLGGGCRLYFFDPRELVGLMAAMARGDGFAASCLETLHHFLAPTAAPLGATRRCVCCVTGRLPPADCR